MPSNVVNNGHLDNPHILDTLMHHIRASQCLAVICVPIHDGANTESTEDVVEQAKDRRYNAP